MAETVNQNQGTPFFFSWNPSKLWHPFPLSEPEERKGVNGHKQIIMCQSNRSA